MNAKSESQVSDTLPQSSAAAVAPVVRLSEVPRPVPAAVPQVTGLAAGQLASVDGLPGAVTLRFGSVEVTATLHASVDPAVLRRAFERNELVIAQQYSDGWLVIGAQRTSATPGLGVGDNGTISARRVTVNAEHELVLKTGIARIALASVGRIETPAKHITSRASGVHKIIGRAIQLN